MRTPTRGSSFVSDAEVAVGQEGSVTQSREPFLSVVLVLEEDGLLTLEDLLVSLDSQSNQDFDLAILPVGLGPERCEDVRAAVTTFSASLAARTRVVPRSPFPSVLNHPGGWLATHLAHSRGRYVAIIDHDVVLFGRWAAELALLAERMPGAVLCSLGATQAFVDAEWPGGKSGYEAIEAPAALGSGTLSSVSSSITAAGLLGTFALPTAGISELGFNFDAVIDVGWDQELFDLASSRFGVSEPQGAVTVLRRMWPRRAQLATGDRFSSSGPSEEAGHVAGPTTEPTASTTAEHLVEVGPTAKAPAASGAHRVLRRLARMMRRDPADPSSEGERR